MFDIEGVIVDPNNVYPERGVISSTDEFKTVYFGGSSELHIAENSRKEWPRFALERGYRVMVSWTIQSPDKR